MAKTTASFIVAVEGDGSCGRLGLLRKSGSGAAALQS